MKPFHLELLEQELSRRKQKNSRYSLRAFASHLEIDPSALSRILSGKQELSIQSSIQVIKKLKLSDDERDRFISSIAEERYHQALTALGTALNESPGVFKQLPRGQSGGRLEALLLFNPDRIALMDLEQRFLMITPLPLAFLGGKSRDEYIGRTVHELGLPASVADALEAQQKEVIATRSPSAIEYVIDCEIYRRFAVPVFDAEGKLESIMIHVRTITAEKRAIERAQALLALNSAYAASLDMSAIAELTVNTIRQCAVAQSAAVRIAEGSWLRMLAAAPVADFTDFNSIAIDDPVYPASACFRSRLPIWMENLEGIERNPKHEALTRSMGLSTIAALPLMVGERCVGTIGLGFSDRRAITEEERVFLLTVASTCAQALERARLFEEERAGRRAAERDRGKLRDLLDSLPVMCWTMTPEMRMDYCNPAYRAFLGFDPLSFTHCANWWHSTIHPDEIPSTEAEMKRGLSAGLAFELIRRHRRSDGSYRQVRCRHTPVRSPDGELLAWISRAVELEDAQ